jgi:hypothetical protein
MVHLTVVPNLRPQIPPCTYNVHCGSCSKLEALRVSLLAKLHCSNMRCHFISELNDIQYTRNFPGTCPKLQLDEQRDQLRYYAVTVIVYLSSYRACKWFTLTKRRSSLSVVESEVSRVLYYSIELKWWEIYIWTAVFFARCFVKNKSYSKMVTLFLCLINLAPRH